MAILCQGCSVSTHDVPQALRQYLLPTLVLPVPPWHPKPTLTPQKPSWHCQSHSGTISLTVAPTGHPDCLNPLWHCQPHHSGNPTAVPPDPCLCHPPALSEPWCEGLTHIWVSAPWHRHSLSRCPQISVGVGSRSWPWALVSSQCPLLVPVFILVPALTLVQAPILAPAWALGGQRQNKGDAVCWATVGRARGDTGCDRSHHKSPQQQGAQPGLWCHWVRPWLWPPPSLAARVAVLQDVGVPGHVGYQDCEVPEGQHHGVTGC